MFKKSIFIKIVNVVVYLLLSILLVTSCIDKFKKDVTLTPGRKYKVASFNGKYFYAGLTLRDIELYKSEPMVNDRYDLMPFIYTVRNNVEVIVVKRARSYTGRYVLLYIEQADKALWADEHDIYITECIKE